MNQELRIGVYNLRDETIDAIDKTVKEWMDVLNGLKPEKRMTDAYYGKEEDIANVVGKYFQMRSKQQGYSLEVINHNVLMRIQTPECLPAYGIENIKLCLIGIIASYGEMLEKPKRRNDIHRQFIIRYGQLRCKLEDIFSSPEEPGEWSEGSLLRLVEFHCQYIPKKIKKRLEKAGESLRNRLRKIEDNTQEYLPERYQNKKVTEAMRIIREKMGDRQDNSELKDNMSEMPTG